MRMNAVVLCLCVAFHAGCGDLDQGNPGEGDGVILGSVKTTEGATVANVGVTVLDNLSVYASTDQQGAFSMPEVPAGIHTLLATTADGLGASVQATVFGGETTTVEILLAPSGQAAGVVVLEGEQDFTGTLVYLAGTSFAGYTDDDGRFLLRTVVPGCYRLRAEHSGFYPKELERVCVESGGTKTLQEITLLREGTPECAADGDCELHQACHQGICQFEEGYTGEACDGKDNDGDGSIDEGLAELCGSGVGACAPGISICLGGRMTACQGGVESQQELCDDDLDNDCDGSTDECGSCVAEGGWFPIEEQRHCCEGLVLLPVSQAVLDGSCQLAHCGVYGVCARCGDGSCGIGENFCTCPTDCQDTCVQPGGVMIGDTGCCDGNPFVAALPLADQGCSLYACVACGDGSCDYGEREATCPQDCAPPPCGDGTCNSAAGEDACSCLQDCPDPVPECCQDSDCPPYDCGPCCVPHCSGLHVCEPFWLPDCCYNNRCEPGETPESCPEDCTNPICSNGYCDVGETTTSCPQDCCPVMSHECTDAGYQGDLEPFCLGADLYECALACHPDCGCDEQLVLVQTGAAQCAPCVPEGRTLPEERMCCDGLGVLNSNFIPDNGSCTGTYCWEPVCADCGDQICGPGENYCSCPQDCSALTCVQEGGLAMNDLGVFDCCPGLTPVDATDIAGCSQYLCVNCGDQVCGPGENSDNCLADCGPCLKEGDWFPIDEGKQCCEGLSLLQVSQAVVDGTCQAAQCGVYGVCARCGDGSCGIGENFCTCPADCQDTCVQPGGVMIGDTGCCDGNPFVTALPLADQGCSLYACVACGDGSCDYGERDTTCPQDCALECFVAGHSLPDGGVCCPGLTVLNSNFATDAGECMGSWCGWCWMPVCADCGDGLCGPGENYCSCAQDCGTLTCVQELGVAAYYSDPPTDCCAGLTPVDAPGVVDHSLYMCVNCGDQDCGLGENASNCPADCQ